MNQRNQGENLQSVVIVDVDFHIEGRESSNTMPEPFGEIVERVNEADQRYFDRHTWAHRYTRVYVPGECWPLFGDTDYLVTVYRGIPGMRARLVHRPEAQVPDRLDLSTLKRVDTHTLPVEAAKRLAALEGRETKD